MRQEDTEGGSKWQPVMVILRGGGRLECKCGALAIFVIGKLEADKQSEILLDDIDSWCQACYQKAQEEESDE